MKHFVILSQGSYEYYIPTYYSGDMEITDEELNRKVSYIIQSMPNNITETRSDRSKLLASEIKKWLNSKGFSEIPENIPEINIDDYDFPTSNENEFS